MQLLDFKKCRDAIAQLEKQKPAFLEKFLKKKALQALMKTKFYTPIDTGNLEDNWYLSSVERNGNMLQIWLINEVEYASYVEYGHETSSGSMVPGQYMSTISIQEAEKEMPVELQNEFLQFAKSLGAA